MQSELIKNETLVPTALGLSQMTHVKKSSSHGKNEVDRSRLYLSFGVNYARIL